MIIEALGENKIQLRRYGVSKTFDVSMVATDTLIIKVPLDATLEVTQTLDNRIEIVYKQK
jgi:hypothetical protein